MTYQTAKENDYFKYKSILFYGFIIGIVTTFFGIILFRDAYYIYSVIYLCYCAIKFLQMAIIQGYVNVKLTQSLKKFQERKKNRKTLNLMEITHIFIVPNFNEDLALLRQTLSYLATHSKAGNYCVFLAMQQHEVGHQQKAQALIEQYKSKFRLISYTAHKLQPNQAKGKPSNINWCARHMSQKLEQQSINIDSVMITIIDADSLVPQPQIDLVEQHIQRNYENIQKYIYQAPQIFYRNNNQAAFFVDKIDNFMSFTQCSQFVSLLGFTMGVSNYTISYKLLKRIGFWETCKFSIDEDVRIVTKAFWKTGGETQTVPIYIPFNQLNLQTKKGYWTDLIARFTQAKRHSQAQIEISYNISNFIENPTGNILKKLNICYFMLEIFYIMFIQFPNSLLVIIFQQQFPILVRKN